MYRPKVGEECIMTWVNGVENGIVTITYVGDGVACYKSKINNYSGELVEFTCALDSVTFRPLKSKRDEDIEEMCIDAVCDNSPITKTICEHIYDAGYRKQMPYSQFVSILRVYLGEEFKWSDSFALMKAMDLAEKLDYTPEEN
jgi:hypothetical protein